jgi:hypothetical protein
LGRLVESQWFRAAQMEALTEVDAKLGEHFDCSGVFGPFGDGL